MKRLKVINLHKNYMIKRHILEPYEKIEVLKQISFELESGEDLAILGSSGSGKSTFARMICMLESWDEGEIYLDDLNLSKLKFKEQRAVRKHIQYVFQNTHLSLNPKRNIMQLLKDVCINFDLKFNKTDIVKTLQSLGLKEDILDKKSYEISGGMAARVALARALIIKPEFLILDEITSGLDFLNQKKLLVLLKELKKTYNISYIFITHNLEIAEFLCKKAIILENGKVAYSGTFEGGKQNEHYIKFQKAIKK